MRNVISCLFVFAVGCYETEPICPAPERARLGDCERDDGSLMGNERVCGRVGIGQYQCERDGVFLEGLDHDECIGHGPNEEPAGEWVFRDFLYVCDGVRPTCGHVVTGEAHAPCHSPIIGGMSVAQCMTLDDVPWTLVDLEAPPQ